MPCNPFIILLYERAIAKAYIYSYYITMMMLKEIANLFLGSNLISSAKLKNPPRLVHAAKTNATGGDIMAVKVDFLTTVSDNTSCFLLGRYIDPERLQILI